MQFEPKDLIAVANWVMPFGKYKGRRIAELPEAYLLWFQGRGFPTGDLGRVMALALTLKENDLESLVRPLHTASGQRLTPGIPPLTLVSFKSGILYGDRYYCDT
jgi:uncharacterized protein (DUF3820 family)